MVRCWNMTTGFARLRDASWRVPVTDKAGDVNHRFKVACRVRRAQYTVAAAAGKTSWLSAVLARRPPFVWAPGRLTVFADHGR
jgi:hypothetical protein